jgi:hypothetical protein
MAKAKIERLYHVVVLGGIGLAAGATGVAVVACGSDDTEGGPDVIMHEGANWDAVVHEGPDTIVHEGPSDVGLPADGGDAGDAKPEDAAHDAGDG